ncbi:hypothetical protein [Ensifer sp. YR511]|uniref:hypothetical protein n=1 Tax=Ensifer sp. YR511 TaxID=1855294 RepID=UPI00088769ED|nr:hypothetical protein [Ensifer sp. YR511]SDN43326.1 hypothetical protein SAMN05216328_12684 [Ensifer sp. YR511]
MLRNISLPHKIRIPLIAIDIFCRHRQPTRAARNCGGLEAIRMVDQGTSGDHR